jgi:tRNA-specific 2-thiouridylase
MDMLDKKKVLVGMSGGVDSTVAAYVLKQQGYDVIGVTMKLWEEDTDEYFEKEGGCCSLSSVEDARRVCEKLDIPFYVVNFKEVFQKTVVDYFLDEYKAGRTPNPCIACNKFVKFEALLKKAHDLGAYYVATGHYAKVLFNEETNRFNIDKSNEKRKDQTYALYNLTQEQIKHILMPLGEFESKDEVREIASSFDFAVGSKSDSQEICFIPDDNYPKFVDKYVNTKDLKGNFIDKKGVVLGKHEGIHRYTIGQRKGLGITFGKPAFVVDIKSKSKDIVIGDNVDVFAQGLIGSLVNFITIEKLTEPMEIEVKVRYSAKPAKATIYPNGEDSVKVIFEEKQRAITPGQAVVFYSGEKLVGGATIERAVEE